MLDFVKKNIGKNILVVNSDIINLVQTIGINETTKEISDTNVVYLATTLYMYGLRNGTKYYNKLVQQIVELALMKLEINKRFDIKDKNRLISYKVDTGESTRNTEQELIDAFINNTKNRQELLWLIATEYATVMETVE